MLNVYPPQQLVRINKKHNIAVEVVTVYHVDSRWIDVQGKGAKYQFPLDGEEKNFKLEEITPKRLEEVKYQEMRDFIDSFDANTLNWSQIERIMKIIQEDI